jgi:hypothetical protein
LSETDYKFVVNLNVWRTAGFWNLINLSLTNEDRDDTRYARDKRSCETREYRKRIKRETCNNRHFDVELAPEFFDTQLTICITVPDKSGEGSMQVTDFKIWQRIGY